MAEVAPATTVTVAGRVALVLLALNLSTKPPVGAGPLRETVPVDEAPPITDAGTTETPVNVAGLIVSVAVFVEPASTPLMVADTTLDTAVVDIVKEAVVAPALTVTVVGQVALVELEDKLTTIPLVLAGPVKVTVPVDDVPPMTELGDTVRLLNVAGVIVRAAVLVDPP